MFPPAEPPRWGRGRPASQPRPWTTRRHGPLAPCVRRREEALQAGGKQKRNKRDSGFRSLKAPVLFSFDHFLLAVKRNAYRLIINLVNNAGLSNFFTYMLSTFLSSLLLHEMFGFFSTSKGNTLTQQLRSPSIVVQISWFASKVEQWSQTLIQFQRSL